MHRLFNGAILEHNGVSAVRIGPSTDIRSSGMRFFCNTKCRFGSNVHVYDGVMAVLLRACLAKRP